MCKAFIASRLSLSDQGRIFCDVIQQESDCFASSSSDHPNNYAKSSVISTELLSAVLRRLVSSTACSQASFVQYSGTGFLANEGWPS